jgi:hypothetical protein
VQIEMSAKSESIAAPVLPLERSNGPGPVAPSAMPLVTLPAQFNDLTHRSYFQDGERRLMVAVLEAGMRDYLMNANPKTSEQRMRFAEVTRWMDLTSPRPYLFSFQGLCEALGIDPRALRRVLDAMRRSGTPDRPYAIASAAGRYRSVRRIAVPRKRMSLRA